MSSISEENTLDIPGPSDCEIPLTSSSIYENVPEHIHQDVADDQSQVSCSTFFYDFASLFKLIFTLSKIDQIIICLKKKYNSTVEK